MHALSITVNLPVTDLETARDFYTGFLGLRDVEATHAEACRLGYEIVHPLTIEPWGVRRFFVRAPDGNVYNIVQNH